MRRPFDVGLSAVRVRHWPPEAVAACFPGQILAAEGNSVKTSAPTQVKLPLSLVFAMIGNLAGLADIPGLPVPGFWIVVVGYGVLAAGCLLKRV